MLNRYNIGQYIFTVKLMCAWCPNTVVSVHVSRSNSCHHAPTVEVCGNRTEGERRSITKVLNYANWNSIVYLRTICYSYNKHKINKKHTSSVVMKYNSLDITK